MASVEKGTVVRVKNIATYDHAFKGGAVVTATGEDFGPHHRGTWSNFVTDEGSTQFLLPEHYDLVEAVKPVEKKVVVEAPVIKVEGEIPETEVNLPNKVVYGILNADDDIYATTADRDFARELKAALGGKRKGVRIFQYAAVKEIR